MRQLCHVPEHIAELLCNGVAALVGEAPLVITDHLFHLVRHFTGLTTKPKGWIDGIAATTWVEGCQGRLLLIGVEIHGNGPVIASATL